MANQFKEFENSLEDATGSFRVHLSGDLILVHNVLSGLVISQVESTAFSLSKFPLFVLVALTRRFGPSMVVILPVGLASGTWVVGAMAQILGASIGMY